MLQKKLAALMVLVGFVASAVGCNTIEGIGKDVKAAGGAVEKAAEKTKTY